MSGLVALLFGATGATGKHLLREVLSSNAFSQVGEYGRSVGKTDQLPSTEKLTQKTVNFEKIEQEGLKDGNWDVVFITLGTTRKAAGSAEAFERIDREYVVNAAKAAKSDDPSRKQRLIYLSSTGSSPTSMLLYSKSKGLTEQALANLGYDDVIIFRPALLAEAGRPAKRLLEGMASYVTHYLSKISDSMQIPVATLAKSMRIAGELGSTGLPENVKTTTSWGGPFFTVIDNAGALKLAASQ